MQPPVKSLFNLRGCPCQPSETLTALFISKKGNRLSMRTAEDDLQKLIKRDGEFVMPHPVPHTLRHCFASHFLETEKYIVILKAMLGHASHAQH